MSEKEKRAANFSIKEIEFLIQLIENKKGTIECKKSDRTTAEDKVRSWKEVEADFNAEFDSFRSFKTLKTKYENLKKSAKKNFAKDKQESYKTGGGPKPASNVTSIDEEILQIVQEEQIAGHESIYDDDFVSGCSKYKFI